MAEQYLSIQVPELLYTRLQRVAESISISPENLVVQTLEATIPAHAEDTLQPYFGQPDAHQEPIVIVFQRMSSATQVRMEALMTENTEGKLTRAEHVELTALVAEYEQIMLTNSEALWRLNQTTVLPIMN